MQKILSLILIAVFIVACPFAAIALPTATPTDTIDGSLDDWGVDILDSGGGDTWVPESGVTYVEEDLRGEDAFRVYPGWGGQPFDAEAMFVVCNAEDGYLYVAIVVGMPSTGTTFGSETYYPGDLAIDFEGGTDYEFGVETTGDSGFNQGAVVRTDESDWENASELDFPDSWPDQIDDGTVVFYDPDLFVYSGAYTEVADDGNTYDHYVIELAIPISVFEDFWGLPFTLHWTMTCGNDELNLRCNPPPPVPEPTTMLMFGAGVAAFAVMRRKKNGRKDSRIS